MKRILLTAFVFCASVCGLSAQDKATSEGIQLENEDQKAIHAKRAEEWKAMLVKELVLTDEQQKKITEMDQAFADRGKSIAENASLTAEEKKEKSMALRKARHAQFTSMLTPVQQEKYKEILDSKKNGK